MASKIYLASASPRRQLLLRQLGIDFDVVTPDVPERRAPNESPSGYAQRMAGEKARQALNIVKRERLPQRPVLAADTCVIVDDQILGKPRNRGDGEAMLRRLSGCEHTVLTAVTVLAAQDEHSMLSTSRVHFRKIADFEIARYWETAEPADKAGAYALQGRAAVFVSRIEGSYSGIVGLPLYEVGELLKKIGFEIL